jgi:citrate synthase
MAWMKAAEALAALEVLPQTLYANVSRGRIRSKPDPKDPHRSLYHGDDVKRLASRRRGRRPVATIAAEAIEWGDPVLTSGISTVYGGRLWYRGHDAVALADTATLEDIAALIWEADNVRFMRPYNTSPRTSERNASPLRTALQVLSARADADLPALGRSRNILVAEAAGLVDGLALGMIGTTTPSEMVLHKRLAAAWRASKAEDVLRRAMVLLADHELNASTFAARVAASTGAPLAAGLLAGAATLVGPRHGGAAAGVNLLIEAARRKGVENTVRDRLGQGNSLPGFGHPLYAQGDPRAAALLAHLRPRAIYAELGSAVEALTGEQPNIDFAIAAMADFCKLPSSAPLTIFALARSVGWIAHILEQLATGRLIRPRARYIGPPLVQSIADAQRAANGAHIKLRHT